jgi:hypothetical protein
VDQFQPPIVRPPTYRERLQAGAQRYTTLDRQQLIAFRRSLLGEGAPEASEAYVRWFCESGSHETAANHLWVYRHKGHIVGQLGAVPVTLKVRERKLTAAWIVQELVDPHHNIRGIGSVLTEKCSEEFDALLGLEVPPETRQTLRRSGWVDLGAAPLFTRVVDPERILGSRWPGRGWTHVAARAADLPLGFVDAVVAVRCLTQGVTLEEVDRFDERIDFLWERTAHCYPVTVRRAHTRLNWRYADFPDPQRYRRFIVKHGDELVGYAVLRLDASSDYPTGHIVDYFCAPEWAWFVLARSVDALKRLGAAIVYCLHVGASGGKALQQLGFIRRQSAGPLMFRVQQLPSLDVSALCRTENWFVTAGDAGADSPPEHRQVQAAIVWEDGGGDSTSEPLRATSQCASAAPLRPA